MPSGYIIFDDYGFPNCPSARQAVDEVFASLPTAQCLVVKLPASASGAMQESSAPVRHGTRSESVWEK